MDYADTARTATFAAVFIALYTGHYIGDYWIQAGSWACNKGLPGWKGRLACAAHVATYIAAGLALLGALALVLDLPIDLAQLAAGTAINAATHYIADRRTPLQAIARALGRGDFMASCTVVRVPGAPAVASGPGTGAFHLDQSWHFTWIFVTALVTVA